MARLMDGFADEELVLSGIFLRLERSTSRRIKGKSGMADFFFDCDDDASSRFLLLVDFCELSISGGLDGSQKLVVDI